MGRVQPASIWKASSGRRVRCARAAASWGTGLPSWLARARAPASTSARTAASVHGDGWDGVRAQPRSSDEVASRGALMASSKKGFGALQLQRMIGTNYETAWFLFHRLRECANDPKIGGEGKIVEADETKTRS